MGNSAPGSTGLIIKAMCNRNPQQIDKVSMAEMMRGIVATQVKVIDKSAKELVDVGRNIKRPNPANAPPANPDRHQRLDLIPRLI
jgi:hypothetical protein